MRNAINVISFLVIGISVLLIWHFKSETEDNVNKLNRASAELVMIAINNFYSKNADYPEDIRQLMDYISHPDSFFTMIRRQSRRKLGFTTGLQEH